VKAGNGVVGGCEAKDREENQFIAKDFNANRSRPDNRMQINRTNSTLQKNAIRKYIQMALLRNEISDRG